VRRKEERGIRHATLSHVFESNAPLLAFHFPLGVPRGGLGGVSGVGIRLGASSPSRGIFKGALEDILEKKPTE